MNSLAKKTICITGATGFIGKNLLSLLSKKQDLNIVALTRNVDKLKSDFKKENITWRQCNGFSLLEVEKATEGVDILIYLIHSMAPSTTLSQGTFSDFDIYTADNFSRAAKKNNIKKIIYLSGLIPDVDKLSPHLLSRLEVEHALAQYSNSLITLRAGLIVGKNGSSFRILERLVRRLPGFICPAWTLSRCQPIDISDVLKTIEYCIDKNLDSGFYDIGGPDVLTYKDMLLTTAKVLKRKRWIMNVPFFSPGLSKLWVSKVTSTSSDLVYPLIHSLKHDMVVDQSQELKIPGHQYCTFEKSLRLGVTKPKSLFSKLRDFSLNFNFRWLRNVTSFQRMQTPWGEDAGRVAKEYFVWLPRFLSPFIKVEFNNDVASFYSFPKIKLLEITKSHERSSPDRSLYYITGGLLMKPTKLHGRLEFRYVECAKIMLIALQDYRPALPWFIYKYTQALVHLLVMSKFRKYLQKSIHHKTATQELVKNDV